MSATFAKPMASEITSTTYHVAHVYAHISGHQHLKSDVWENHAKRHLTLHEHQSFGNKNTSICKCQRNANSSMQPAAPVIAGSGRRCLSLEFDKGCMMTSIRWQARNTSLLFPTSRTAKHHCTHRTHRSGQKTHEGCIKK